MKIWGSEQDAIDYLQGQVDLCLTIIFFLVREGSFNKKTLEKNITDTLSRNIDIYTPSRMKGFKNSSNTILGEDAFVGRSEKFYDMQTYDILGLADTLKLNPEKWS